MEPDKSKFEKAGKIASDVRSYALSQVKEGAKLLDVAKAIEAKIISLGSRPAFPVNISINETAAHYTPRYNDETVFKKGDLVKLDFGVHVDGYPADTATSISVGKSDENQKLIDASAEALKAAIAKVRPGVKVSEIGAEIEATAKKFGVNVIRNLSGHGVERYDLHSDPSIPNFDNGDNTELPENKTIAIEPFMTYGKGMIKEAEACEIYKVLEFKPVRDREVLDFIRKEYGTLPFAKRWIIEKFGVSKAANAIREAISKGVLHEYNILKEVSGAKVAQSEHTILVKEKSKILTA